MKRIEVTIGAKTLRDALADVPECERICVMIDYDDNDDKLAFLCLGSYSSADDPYPDSDSCMFRVSKCRLVENSHTCA